MHFQYYYQDATASHTQPVVAQEAPTPLAASAPTRHAVYSPHVVEREADVRAEAPRQGGRHVGVALAEVGQDDPLSPHALPDRESLGHRAVLLVPGLLVI